MADHLSSALREHFGHEEFRPLQREIIQNLVNGQNTLAILPTGGGKSLTYQLPAILSGGLTVVISPLLSLIKDQTEALQKKGIAVARLDSTLNKQEREGVYAGLQQGEFKLLYTSPESLAHPDLLKTLRQCTLSLVAIDEAHCISEWGHSFRPSYLYLPRIIRSLKPDAILALTATATRKTASSIRKLFRIKQADQFTASHIRPNLRYQITPTLPGDKNAHLLETLSDSDRLPAVVYVMRQEHCEEVAHFLSQQGFRARSYHAGLNHAARSRIQDDFLNDDIQVVVATIAFGMGVDKPNIRSVIHYHLPKSPEGWMQESGRAGRDGKPSLCQLLACQDDTIPLRNFSEAKKISRHSLTNLVETLYSQGKEALISPYHTRVRHDVQSSVFEITLAHLEVTGHIKFQASSWRYLNLYPLFGRTEDLNGYPPKVKKAFQHIVEGEERYDTHQSQEDFGISTPTLWKHLESLEKAGSLKVRKSGWLWHYKINKPDTDTAELAVSLFTLLNNQRDQELSKLEQVVKIATSRSCIPNQLAKWFGERPGDPCGQCSSCQGEKRPRQLPHSKQPPLAAEQIATINELVAHPKKRFKTNQQLTRFLCGIPSPYLRHYWLNRHKHFGLLTEYPYDDVLAQVRANLNAHD